jgi:hypothetical protein
MTLVHGISQISGFFSSSRGLSMFKAESLILISEDHH